MNIIYIIMLGITILTIIRKIKDPYFQRSEERIKHQTFMLELHLTSIIASEIIIQAIFFFMYGYIVSQAYIRFDMFLFGTGMLQMLCVVVDAIDAVSAYLQGDSFRHFFWISKKWYWIPNFALDVVFLIGLAHYLLFLY